MPPKKRSALTLEQRVEVIRKSEKEHLSNRKIAEQLGVGRTQIDNVLKRKAEVLTDFENNMPIERKRQRRPTGNEEINILVWQWFQDATSRRINVSGPLIQEKALKFASDLGIETFKASNGWLDSFKLRHNIIFGTMSGERGDVNNTVVDDWKSKLSTLCAGYAPADIFNMDETGLFFRDTTKNTLKVKGDECVGGKRSKERITIALCASMTGEKVTPLVIGKSKQPRCFSKIKPETLPVMYCNNKKAWMNSSLFESWLSKFNNRMKRQNRHVLLFVDNAPSHPTVNFSNVKLQFLPPNTTSKSQPMDQGIIQTLKLKFRKRQLQHVIYEMDKDKSKCGSQLLKDITILQAIYWIHRSWQEVETTTIQKCFAKCGFQDLASQHLSDDSDSDYDQDDNVPLKVVSMARQLFGCDFQELVQLDQHMSTCDQNVRDWSKSANELLADLDGPSLSDNDEDTDVEPQQKAPCTLSELDFYISEIKNFALVNGRQRMLDSVMEIEEDVVVQRIKVVKQCLISDFMQ